MNLLVISLNICESREASHSVVSITCKLCDMFLCNVIFLSDYESVEVRSPLSMCMVHAHDLIA